MERGSLHHDVVVALRRPIEHHDSGCGLPREVDERARVVGANGLHAAGADVGGISGGGYSSGLAAALVFGRIAAETALS